MALIDVAILNKLQEKAEVGDAQAQFELAEFYRSNEISEDNIELMMELYEKAALQGHEDGLPT